MRFIKLLVLSVVAFVIIFMGLSAMFPSHLRISRAIDISSPGDLVFKTVGDLDTWKTWNGFVKNTPLTHISVSAPAQGAGAFIHSDELQIALVADTPDSVTSIWQQRSGRTFKSGYNILHLRPGTTTVQWYFDFRFHWYPWEKLSSLLYEKQLGPVMEESLTVLKSQMENLK